MNTPRLITSHYCASILATLAASSRYFYLATFSAFITNDWRTRDARALLDHISARASSGLDSRILLSAPVSIKRLTSRNSASYYYINSLSIPCRLYPGPSVLHEKFCVADDLYCTIGSHNLTYSSLHRNLELSVAFESLTCAQAIRSHFLDLWQKAKSP